MNLLQMSPYIRVAMFSTLTAPFQISPRAIFDYEIILVDGGKCQITIDGVPHLCKKGDVVFLRPGVPHRFDCVEDCDFVQPHIHFDPIYSGASEERFVSFKPQSRMTPHELSLIQPDIFAAVPIPNVFTPGDSSDFKALFFKIIQLFQSRAYGSELLYKARLLELLHCILTQFDHAPTLNSEAADPIIAAKNYIDNNFFSIITLDSLAKQFYFNKFTLMRRFKAMYQQSILAYYRTQRLDYAKTALAATTLSVTELSQRLNFTDIYSFSRFFKTHTGCSPRAYRKQHAQK